LRELDWGSRALRRKAREVEEANVRLRSKLGRAASEQEIASELAISLEDYQILLGDLKGLEIGSLHFADDEDGRPEDVSDKVVDVRPTPFDCFESAEQKRLLAKWIDELPERERQVLSLYYYEELPMKEIGLLLGVVESRVSQLHTSAVARLRARIRGERDSKAAKNKN
jgi:RNA polymerase sigma factor for flagellar operon FliA